MSSAKDFPLLDCARLASERISDGGTVFQKWTCQHYGSRQTMPDANKFYLSGICEECGNTTNIEARGCNYVLVLGPSTEEVQKMINEMYEEKKQ